MAMKMLGIAVLVSTLFMGACGLGIDLDNLSGSPDEVEDRFLIGATGSVPFNASQLATIIGLLAAALLPLLGLICLCFLGMAALVHYSSGTYDSYGTTYRALGLDEIDWETLSIIDWIQVGEETFRKFDPTNMECQKRVVCELHQNVKQFGSLAAKIVDLFGYLKYLEIFNLPDMITGITEEYQDAADRGRSLKKDCGEMFPHCEFSIKAIYDRYHGNEIE